MARRCEYGHRQLWLGTTWEPCRACDAHHKAVRREAEGPSKRLEVMKLVDDIRRKKRAAETLEVVIDALMREQKEQDGRRS